MYLQDGYTKGHKKLRTFEFHDVKILFVNTNQTIWPSYEIRFSYLQHVVGIGFLLLDKTGYHT